MPGKDGLEFDYSLNLGYNIVNGWDSFFNNILWCGLFEDIVCTFYSVVLKETIMNPSLPSQ